jgi:hypothetical protein
MRDAIPAVVMKSAIPHHLCVETTVVGIIDLLRHEAVQRAHGVQRRVDLDT